LFKDLYYCVVLLSVPLLQSGDSVVQDLTYVCCMCVFLWILSRPICQLYEAVRAYVVLFSCF